MKIGHNEVNLQLVKAEQILLKVTVMLWTITLCYSVASPAISVVEIIA